METSISMHAINQQIADEINAEASRDPNSPYAGKFIGIAHGKMVVVADNLDEAIRQFEKQGVEPSHRFIIETGIDYSIPVEIWNVS